MPTYEPPFAPNNRIFTLAAEIGVGVGKLEIQENQEGLKLRRENRIRSIHSSLAIENNTLSLDEVADVINGKRVIAPPRDILEAKNAYDAYGMMDTLNPHSIEDLLKAHGVMMTGLIEEAGCFRTGGVGVFTAGGDLVHMAPPPEFVWEHIAGLLKWLQTTTLHPLIASSIFHYEFEFIHPFGDGNGRMGRLWQSLLLSKWQPVFAWLPVETIVKDRQDEYYQKIRETTAASNSAIFVEFMLDAILETVTRRRFTDPVADQDIDPVTDPVERLLQALGAETLSATELMKRLGLTHRPHFRQYYLSPALARGLVERTVPDKPSSKNQRYKKA